MIDVYTVSLYTTLFTHTIQYKTDLNVLTYSLTDNFDLSLANVF